MKIISFQIKNFRSILDTGRIELSSDNITTLVGQNESGKSAVLDALATTFSHRHSDLDDLRDEDKLPVVLIETQSEVDGLDEFVSNFSHEATRIEFLKRLKLLKGKLKWRFFTYLSDDEGKPRTTYIFDNLDCKQPPLSSEEKLQEGVAEVLTQTFKKDLRAFETAIYESAPTFIPFEENSGILPNRIDIPADSALKGRGSTAALNFLTIAGIDLKKLLAIESKPQVALLKKANRKITEDFRAFWKQNIGEASGIELSCSIHQYGAGKEKQGQSYLEFLISDGDNILHPQQRSRGTRWFISFFLQLRASEEANSDHFYLLDEPGSNLHERAQNDVINLIEKISSKIGVIYSTHSPHLIREERINRIIAVERDADQPGHPTRLIGAHALGAANIDTLSPIYTAMGVSLARQTAIKNKNNVILEELSAQYYLRAFWILKKCTQTVSFLPATGASNIPTLANLFLGWGLDFIIVLDDEGTGRGVFNRLKRDLFLDDANWAKRRMLKLAGCDGIEDVFESGDYKSHVALECSLKADQKNSGWAKSHGAAKAIHALKFLHKVESGEISLEMLHEKSRENIGNLVDEIADRLNSYAGNSPSSQVAVPVPSPISATAHIDASSSG
jgi:energy-coupling factor transporter ATP-binding protein EcfA2